MGKNCDGAPSPPPEKKSEKRGRPPHHEAAGRYQAGGAQRGAAGSLGDHPTDGRNGNRGEVHEAGGRGARASALVRPRMRLGAPALEHARRMTVPRYASASEHRHSRLHAHARTLWLLPPPRARGRATGRVLASLDSASTQGAGRLGAAPSVRAIAGWLQACGLPNRTGTLAGPEDPGPHGGARGRGALEGGGSSGGSHTDDRDEGMGGGVRRGGAPRATPLRCQALASSRGRWPSTCGAAQHARLRVGRQKAFTLNVHENPF